MYLCAVVISLAGASYLIAHEIRTDWVFASGLLGLACAWTVTTACGYLAIRHGHIDHHQDWMIRSYVVASAFVFFRVFAWICSMRQAFMMRVEPGDPRRAETRGVALLGTAPSPHGARDPVAASAACLSVANQSGRDTTELRAMSAPADPPPPPSRGLILPGGEVASQAMQRRFREGGRTRGPRDEKD
jgi:hypothetical protein